MSETPEVRFARNLRRCRRGQEVTQAELSNRLRHEHGITLDATAITRIEKNQRRIHLNEATALALALGLTLDHLTATQEDE